MRSGGVPRGRPSGRQRWRRRRSRSGKTLQDELLAEDVLFAQRIGNDFGGQCGQRWIGNRRIADVPGLRIHTAAVGTVGPEKAEALQMSSSQLRQALEHAAREHIPRAAA